MAKKQNPSSVKYKRQFSTSVVYLLAFFLLLGGICCFVVAIISWSGMKDVPLSGRDLLQASGSYILLPAGVVLLISSVFLFVIGNISDDIHYMTFMHGFEYDERIANDQAILKRLNRIEVLLSAQQNQPPQPDRPYRNNEAYRPGETERTDETQGNDGPGGSGGTYRASGSNRPNRRYFPEPGSEFDQTF